MNMLIKDTFARDIFRHINSAVVVSDAKDDTVQAEIKEYVFTDDLIEKFFKILDAVLNNKAGKAGIWINGYYGSGKSHFIKYVHYLLNQETSTSAFEALAKGVEEYDSMGAGKDDSITVSNLKLLQKKVEASHCEDIMFNVEDETDDGSQERLTRIFLNMFNKFRGFNSKDIPLAILLEKPLHQKGLLEEFKKKIQSELDMDWDMDAADIAAFQLSEVLEIAKSVFPALDTVSLYSKLSNPDNYSVGINATLIPELKAFLKDKESGYRLLFLVDEVSQYIGSNKEILLNFQNIIERVSQECNNQVWIACTAQQTLDEVSQGADGVTDVQDEFGKILGRFDTRISLQSNDAAYITQRRVLDKNSTGIAELTKLFNKNKDYIENQFKISHELYKGYQSEQEFISAYPFVPYQFKLISHVFEAFQQLRYVIKEVKDNERSVLGITHFTAKKNAEQEVGVFLPFDAFYNEQFSTNLTNRGAKAIENALELNYVKGYDFAQRVVKVLFMISNLLENQRQTFPATVDNLTVLLMDQLDQNKMQLQQKIKSVLDKLIEESIIREDKGSYFFFNEDEMDVQNVIKSQAVNLDERWSTFDGILRPLIRVNQKFTFGQNDFKVGYSVEGKEFLRNGDFKLIILLTDKTQIQAKALDFDKKDLVICINEWFNEDEALRKDFDWHCKTNKYFINNGAGGTGERARTNENFKVRNNELKNRIENRIKQRFAESKFISQNMVLEPDQIHGATPSDRLNNLIEHHLSGIYKNHKLCLPYARTQQDLKASAADKQILTQTLAPAEQVVNDFITTYNNSITVHDLVNKFEAEPFGWRAEALLDVLVHLVKKKKREFVYKGQPRYSVVDFINKAVNTAERMSCEVVTGEDVDQTVLDNAVKAYKHIFNENLSASTDGNELYDSLILRLRRLEDAYVGLEVSYYGKYPFGASFQKAVHQLRNWSGIRDPKTLFSDLIDGQIGYKELFDKAKGMEDFASNNIKEFHRVSEFYNANRENFTELSKDDQDKALKVSECLGSEDPRMEFRHARKAMDELGEALKTLVDNLRKKVTDQYNLVFDELEAEAIKRNVDRSAFTGREQVLSAIKTTDSVGSIRSRGLGAQNFKSEELKKIIAATPIKSGAMVAEPETYYVSGKAATISNEAEMNEYLDHVRTDMTALLKKNKTIILK